MRHWWTFCYSTPTFLFPAHTPDLVSLLHTPHWWRRCVGGVLHHTALCTPAHTHTHAHHLPALPACSEHGGLYMPQEETDFPTTSAYLGGACSLHTWEENCVMCVPALALFPSLFPRQFPHHHPIWVIMSQILPPSTPDGQDSGPVQCPFHHQLTNIVLYATQTTTHLPSHTTLIIPLCFL